MKAPWGMALAVGAAVLLSACASHGARPGKAAGSGSASAGPGTVHDNIQLSQAERYRFARDGGPGRPDVDISKLPEPVPKVEPRSRYGNTSPYEVNGQTYYVLKSAKGYTARGLASWYGTKFDGYLTSSMERYDIYKFSAASKVLPLPTYARVTNLANGKHVIVRVNDRGPFVAGRIIDLSYAAAVRIGIWPKGTGMVEVQAIDPAHPGELSPPGAVAVSAGATRGTWLQVGSFAEAGNAQRMAARLRAAGIGPVAVAQVTFKGRQFTRVRIGPLPDAAAVERMRTAVKRLGLTAAPVTVN